MDITVIRAGLVSGKLSQTTQTFHIVRASARAFERPQWEALEKRLAAWKISLAGVLEVVASAKKRNSPEPPAAVVAAAAATNGTEAAAAQAQVAAA